MGYTTDFGGSFEFNRPLTTTEQDFIKKFNDTRRMKRDVSKLEKMYGGKHGSPIVVTYTPEMKERIKFLEDEGFQVVLTPIKDKRTMEEIYGVDGEYFVGASGHGGQDHDTTIVNYNQPPSGQPGLWCQWTTNSRGTRLEWDGGEKFYSYVEWLEYLIEHFFSKWGVLLNGEVTWDGEDRNDKGKIIVKDNEVIVKNAKITYE